MSTKETLGLDVEVYKNYFLLGFLNFESGNVKQFEMTLPAIEGDKGDIYGEEQIVLNRDAIRNILQRYRVVSFNGNHYDIPIITAALKGADCAKLKDLSDKIIVNNIAVWNLGIGDMVNCDHIDIFEVAPGMASLKIYGGRLHCRKMQDLPIEPGATITPADRELLRTYNANDLVTTKDLYVHLKPQIELREQMSKVYGIDLRSKSDAQIAEAVIVKEVGKSLGQITRPEVPSGTRFAYVPPKFITFETPELQALLATISRLEFLVPDGGNVQMPKELEKAAIRVGAGLYRLGIGGLHSSEQTISHYADETVELTDTDVVSYYPIIILTNNLAPAHMGAAFSRCYRSLVDQRISAKRAGNKVGADTIKIVVNGSFGKFGSKWSKLYSPHLLIQTTLTGQLALLMLIERLEALGVTVTSANTDGVGLKTPLALRDARDAVIGEWERLTGFETESTLYAALHSRDVNNYVALKPDGGLKLKGAYAPAGLQKNPTNEVCVRAVIAFLRDRTPVETTIRQSTDIRQFVTIRQVKGGAVDQQGEYLGKAVRWYYAKGVEGPIRYKVNGYTVARSEGARACMELPETFPEDVDFDWYITEAKSILADVGVDPVSYLVKDLC